MKNHNHNYVLFCQLSNTILFTHRCYPYERDVSSEPMDPGPFSSIKLSTLINVPSVSAFLVYFHQLFSHLCVIPFVTSKASGIYNITRPAGGTRKFCFVCAGIDHWLCRLALVGSVNLEVT